ncbi:MAG: hypothetical protein OHK93_003743 [Ramalina farinacea]|uniref:Uncharacterized protein n=1 Tax=Ramalina farinacea TaxID=258253 RepID=A0AA43QVU1_9LECA|nr:hypothetical protein [Ramalina farinacea]
MDGQETGMRANEDQDRRNVYTRWKNPGVQESRNQVRSGKDRDNACTHMKSTEAPDTGFPEMDPRKLGSQALVIRETSPPEKEHPYRRSQEVEPQSTGARETGNQKTVGRWMKAMMAIRRREDLGKTQLSQVTASRLAKLANFETADMIVFTLHSYLREIGEVMEVSFEAPLAAFACTAVSNVHFTNYGYPDASGLTQYSCNGDQEVSGSVATPLGDGSFAKPYSAALSDTATAFSKCETVYIPYFQKYFKFVDICAQCQTDQGNGILHIDLYLIQSDANIGQTTCEDTLGNFGGTTYTVLRNPASTLTYDSASFFSNGQCNTGAVHSSGANDGCSAVQARSIGTDPVVGTAVPSNLVLESSGIPYVPIATGTGIGGGPTGVPGTGTGFPSGPTGTPSGGWHHPHGPPPRMMTKVRR